MDSIWVPPPPPPMPTAVPFINHAPDNSILDNHIHNHPPYAEMIYRAIEALKEKDGSSKTAIGKYIQKAYSNLPPAHSTLLTHHLKRLKNTGLLVMVKKSYKLPSSLPYPSPPSSLQTSHLSAPQPQRGRGRPPKPKPDNNQNALLALGFADDPAQRTGPGRPPKAVRRGRPPGTARSGFPKRRGRPPKPKSLSAMSNGLKRRPGRPPKLQLQATVIPFASPSLAPPAPPLPVGYPRPRGRPRKNAAALPPPHEVEAGGVSSLVMPGRPQKLAVRGRPKNPAGRPVGRPKGTTSAAIAQKIANEDLRRKVEYFQSKVKESLDVLKPYFNHESPVTAIAAIQELEIVATSDLKAPLKDVSSQQLPEQLPLQEQLPPQPLQLPPQITYQQQHLQTQLQQLFQFQPHTSFPS